MSLKLLSVVFVRLVIKDVKSVLLLFRSVMNLDEKDSIELKLSALQDQILVHHNSIYFALSVSLRLERPPLFHDLQVFS